MNVFIDLPFRGKGIIQTEITVLLVVRAIKNKTKQKKLLLNVLSEGYLMTYSLYLE